MISVLKHSLKLLTLHNLPNYETTVYKTYDVLFGINQMSYHVYQMSSIF